MGNAGVRGPIVSEAVTYPCLPQITELLQIGLSGFLALSAFSSYTITLSFPLPMSTPLLVCLGFRCCWKIILYCVGACCPWQEERGEEETERKCEWKRRDVENDKQDGWLLDRVIKKTGHRQIETESEEEWDWCVQNKTKRHRDRLKEKWWQREKTESFNGLKGRPCTFNTFLN